MAQTIVKICGITNLEDAVCATEAGADMLGFIFYPPSPRAVSVSNAQRIVQQLRAQFAQLPILVGVFVNETTAHIESILQIVGLDLAQLSGKELPETLQVLQPRAYKALRGKQWQQDESLWRIYLHSQKSSLSHPPDLLLEADHDTLYGGTGHRANEALAAMLATQFKLLLAGGLSPDNVAEIVQRIRPWGVDVASGTELSQGIKDHVKIKQFIDTVRNA